MKGKATAKTGKPRKPAVYPPCNARPYGAVRETAEVGAPDAVQPRFLTVDDFLRSLEAVSRKLDEWSKRAQEHRDAWEAQQRQREAKREEEYRRKNAEWEKRMEEERREEQKRVDKLDRLFNLQWGRLVESLVEGDLIPLLNARGIQVHQTTRRVDGCRNGINFEFDILAINGDTVVIVEVKTTLRPDDVKDFVEDLAQARVFMPQFADKRILGAVAYLQEDGKAAVMAAKRGLFVIRATGSSASITNPPDFEPKAF